MVSGGIQRENVRTQCHWFILLSRTRGVHELSWVRLRDFFNPTHNNQVTKKLIAQPNLAHHKSPTQLT